jgi:hypothetical protein
MAFKLNKTQSKDFSALVEAAKQTAELLNEQIEEFNRDAKELFAYVEEAQEAFNEAQEALRDFSKNEIAEQWRDDVSNKSERWQVGERGAAVERLIEEWENFADKLEQLRIEPPEEIEVELPDFEEALPNEEVDFYE